MIDCLAVTLLAMMIQTEAGFESYSGQIAVAYVAINRVEQSGKPLLLVLRQPKHFFINPRLPITDQVWSVAHDVLDKRVPDPTSGADHFLNPRIQPVPEWYDERYVTAKIGRHEFLYLGGF